MKRTMLAFLMVTAVVVCARVTSMVHHATHVFDTDSGDQGDDDGDDSDSGT